MPQDFPLQPARKRLPTSQQRDEEANQKLRRPAPLPQDGGDPQALMALIMRLLGGPQQSPVTPPPQQGGFDDPELKRQLAEQVIRRQMAGK